MKNKKDHKILVIDDDEGILDAFQVVLESEGYIVTTTTDHEYLLKLKKDNIPDLILLDVLLSGADGRSLCKWLKSKNATRDIPVIMISADPTVKQGVHESGCTTFIDKPFEVDNLLNQVEKYLNYLPS